jgi:3-hydroxybutyryl-CoA dehydrogenase
MTSLSTSQPVGVIGAGTMGAGIAQLAAAAGHPVLLFDAWEGAAEKGKARIVQGLEAQVKRGKMSAADMGALVARIGIAPNLEALAGAALAIEAVVEDLDIKRKLFADLERVVGPEAILATNTSSISVTAIGRDLQRPARLVGMHFFNPAPVMKLVEVVSGLATEPQVAATIFDTAKAWGKVAVHAKSTPGFIVNRVARPYYAEALRLCEEQVADPATLDAVMTEGAGFRMGPFALMDLIGNDVNLAVSQSVFAAFHMDPRFRPSNLQQELVNAGRLGRKSGRGHFNYAEGAVQPAPATQAVDPSTVPLTFTLGALTDLPNMRIMPTDGRTAWMVAEACGKPVILTDLTAAPGVASRLAFATSADVPATIVAAFIAALSAQGLTATRLPDWPGLVALRTLAMLANEGFEAVLQGVADEAAVDAAMIYGVNHPKGPMAWAREVGLGRILSVLDHIHALTGDPRYRASLGLRMAC